MRRVFGSIFFSLIITVAFFSAVEVAARIGYSCFKRDSSYLLYGKTFFKLAGRRLASRISSSIGENGAHVIQKDDLIVWLFGGSTTACSYETDEESWPYKLAVRLKGTSAVPVTVVNFGKDGATCKEYVGELEPILAEGKMPHPDIVIIYTGINDSIKLSKYAYTINRRPSPLQILNRKLMDISVAYMLAKMSYCRYFENDVDKAWDGYISADEKELERHLNRLIDLLEDMKPRIFIFYEVLRDSYLKKMPKSYGLPGLASPFDKVKEVIENTAKKRGITFVDTGSDVRSIYRNYERYIDDGMHYNDVGNDVFAEYLTGYLTQNGVIPKSPNLGHKARWQYINLRLVENPPRKIRIYQGQD